MPLHGIGQSPHDSFFVTSFSTAPPSSFMLRFIGKSREPTPFQFLIGASPFSTDSATARVVPCCENERRIDACGDCSLLPMRAAARYIQPSHVFALRNHAMMRAITPRSRLYSSVTRLHTALNSA